MANNKNNVKSKINQKQAARIFFDYLRNNGIKTFTRNEFLEKMSELMFVEDEVIKSDDAWKYYKYMYGWAITELKRSKYIFQDKDTKAYLVNITEPKLLEPVDVANLKWKQYSMQTIFDSIRDTKLLIPDIQRPTAWTSEKNYSELALSIFSWIPLGIMYFWILDKERASEIGHSYIKNEIIPGDELEYKRAKISNMPETVKSVIDGQQRLTALNILIRGSFNNKIMYFDETTPDKMFKFYEEGKQPINAKSLMDIFSKLKTLHEENKGKTIKKAQLKALSKEMYISYDSLERLYKGIFKVEVLSICEIESASLEQITDIFIKVNENGKVLKPIDLMLTYLVSNDNTKKIKSDVIELVKTFRTIKKNIKYPTVMKLITLYFTGNSKSNYTTLINSEKYKKKSEWTKLKKSAKRLVKLLKDYNFDGKDIHSANSLIPVVLWMADNPKKENSHDVDQNILLYIRFAQTFKYFKAGTDDKLSKLTKALKGDQTFRNWKLKDIITKVDDIKTEIKTLNYNTDNSYIKNILKVVGAYMNKSDDTIEHIVAQANGGTHSIDNLALLDGGDNASVGDRSPSEKIDKLHIRYGIKKEIIKKNLLINNKEDRLDIISKKLYQHFLSK